MVLHVSFGQLESGVPDDRGSLSTQQPGVRRQAVHDRRTGRIGEPGPRGEVKVMQSTSVMAAASELDQRGQ